MPAKKKIMRGPVPGSRAELSLGMWRHPRTAYTRDSWTKPAFYQDIALTCERGMFDMVFFADLNYISDSYGKSLEPALRYAAQAPEHDLFRCLSGWRQ